MCHLFPEREMRILEVSPVENKFSLLGQVWEHDEQIFVDLELTSMFAIDTGNEMSRKRILQEVLNVGQGKAIDILAPLSIITEATHVVLKRHCEDLEVL